MEMIIGGACQGKKTYASLQHPGIVWTDGKDCSREELFEADGIYGFQDFIYKEMKDGADMSNLAADLIEKNPDLILISNEVGYGVVPMDAFDRAYREAVGRVCTELAAYSKKVTRVICGIGTVIKDA